MEGAPDRKKAASARKAAAEARKVAQQAGRPAPSGRPSDVFGGELRRRDVFTLLVFHLISSSESGASYGNQLIEQVADSSVEYDRTTKQRIYASAGIGQYWIVNLPEQQIEVYEQPAPPEGRYARRTVYRPGQTVRLAVGPDHGIDVLVIPNLVLEVAK